MTNIPVKKFLIISLCFSFLFGLPPTATCDQNTDSLFIAARDCDQSSIFKYIKTDSLINVSDTNGWPLIMTTLWTQAFSCDLSHTGRGYPKPSSYAVPCCNYKEMNSIISRFLDHNVDLNKSNREGVTPLMLITLTGKHSDTLTDIFINKGADINCADKLGNNLLHIAISQSNLEYLIKSDVYKTSPLINNKPKGENQLFLLV